MRTFVYVHVCTNIAQAITHIRCRTARGRATRGRSLIEADSVTQILSEGENVIREYTTPESVIYNCVNMTVKEA